MNEQEEFDYINSGDMEEIKTSINSRIKDGWTFMSLQRSDIIVEGFLKSNYLVTLVKYKN